MCRNDLKFNLYGFLINFQVFLSVFKSFGTISKKKIFFGKKWFFSVFSKNVFRNSENLKNVVLFSIQDSDSTRTEVSKNIKNNLRRRILDRKWPKNRLQRGHFQCFNGYLRVRPKKSKSQKSQKKSKNVNLQIGLKSFSETLLKKFSMGSLARDFRKNRQKQLKWGCLSAKIECSMGLYRGDGT